MKVKRGLCRLADKLTPLTHHQGSSRDDSQQQRTRLPELTVPKFGGEYLKWPEFKAMFQTVISDRSDLSNLEKFQYLKGALTGSAAQLIANIPPAGESLPVAWQLLTTRFENHRLTVKSHLDRVFSLQPVKGRNVKALQHVLNTVNETIQALKALKIAPTSDCVLVHVVTSLLDQDTREQWELTLGDTQDYPKIIQLTSFLATRLRALESVEASSSSASHLSKVNSPKPPKRTIAYHAAQTSQPTTSHDRIDFLCDMCQGNHFIVNCEAFRKKSISDRITIVKHRSLCCNCLGRHNVRKCLSTKLCRTCAVDEPSQETQPVVSSDISSPTSTLLATAVASIRSAVTSHQVRLLIDQGSELSFVAEHLIRLLNLSRRCSSIEIVGIGGQRVTHTRGLATLSLYSNTRELTLNIDAHILTTLSTVLPSFVATRQNWPHLNNLKLADPDFLIPRAIDIIVGANYYGQVIKPNIIKVSQDVPIAQLSIFGWLVLGPVRAHLALPKTSHQVTIQSSTQHLEDLLIKFWQMEEPPSVKTSQLSPEEAECEQHFISTHSRDSSGRYIVRIPFKSSPARLGNSYPAAHKCLQRTLNRFKRDGEYQLLYTQFMAEYEELGHMEKVSVDASNRGNNYYLPHHGVLRPESTTTKLRVVFNGSCPSSSGLSLNNMTYTGPNLLLNIIDVLLRLRTHRHLFATDITKMYRQIKVHSEDWAYQRILWVDSQLNEVQYNLTTVTYGTKAAPYLAVRTLIQLAHDEGHRFPLAVPSIIHERYVDDIFGGADTKKQLIQTARQLIQLCHAGGFPLAKWHSTDQCLLKEVSPTELTGSSITLDGCNTNILGINWSPQEDKFQFTSMPAPHQTRISKRIVLSQVARIFDPLGLASPVVIRAKMFLQELWLQKLNWDDPLPPQLKSKWLLIKTDLTSLAKLSVPRWFNTLTDTTVTLHGFADASQFATAAVIYLVINSPSTGAKASLVISKTKVAPLKRLTIPRLELSSTLLLSKLMQHVRVTLPTNVSHTYMWTDSQVSLTWIKTHPSLWKDYVRNRVIQIQELSQNAHWRHVPGTQNPADCASRGISAEQLASHELWWTGPPWLNKSEDSWPTQPQGTNHNCTLESRPAVALSVTHVTTEYHWNLIHKYSSLTRLLRITTLCFRFVSKLKKTLKGVPAFIISAEDIQTSRIFWVKATQAIYFASELKALRHDSPLLTTHPFSRLTAFIDTEGVIRVGGRLKNSTLDYDEKHQAILPNNARLTDLIISHSHLLTMHGGTQLTLAHIRQLYWIIGGRKSVKSHILRCVTCARHRGLRAQQLMGQLPTPRVQPSKAFSHTGVDYAGPITLKTWAGRGAKTFKGWISLFSIYTLLQQCTSRWSQITPLKELQRLFSQTSREHQQISATLSQDKTRWHFNPPAAPHMGGKWEAAVKSMKFHIKRTTGDTPLTFEEATTLLSQIEAILNSRPLEPLSGDPGDISALTPGHFLIGTALNALPRPSIIDISTSRLSRWQFIQQRVQQFWSNWSSHYLKRHQAISKWHHPRNEIKENSLVLIVDERLPPGKWPLARVLSLLPGKDGLARVASLKTSNTTLTRPLIKLVPLSGVDQDTSKTTESAPGC
ncbi:hypothetical protein KPH14_012728 [Odynerus spinipes]|uniref:Uncharacterized protein n=1 Tax=Odynerus spinipes TaxID=1348599 RepID=A0AAD9RFG6_9HYME|nr:hypothetical protein KPH14_012728 [Odynerus spinipes]